MPATAKAIEDLTLDLTQEIHVRASLETTFAALLDELGPHNQGGEGQPMPMKIEAWPGGRWYRDLGDHNGHFWGNVQAIKRPTLLEITGPLFSSSPLLSNVQYRLAEKDGGTLITLHHTAFGFMEERHRQGVGTGWASMLERTRQHAEASGAKTNSRVQ
ncbi:MAG TPA: SRPBCC domain-containing protein [Candidatus Acidoferrales bacterium]